MMTLVISIIWCNVHVMQAEEQMENTVMTFRTVLLLRHCSFWSLRQEDSCIQSHRRRPECGYGDHSELSISLQRLQETLHMVGM